MDLVNRYAAALSLHPTPVEAVGEVAGEILERFGDVRPDLLVCFASPHHVGAFDDIAGGLRKLLEPEVMAGCTAVGVAGGGRAGASGSRTARDLGCAPRASARAISTQWSSTRARPTTGWRSRAGPTTC